jgi:hypothetical protein
MDEIKRFKVQSAVEIASDPQCLESTFVRARDFNHEHDLRMRSLALLMTKDLDLANAQVRIAELEENAQNLEDMRGLLDESIKQVSAALSYVGDIRRGCNVTTEELWRACGHLDSAMGTLGELGLRIPHKSENSS